MTRERMAIYLFIIALVKSEPITVFEFELKYNTDKRRDFYWQLRNELENRIGEYSCHAHYYNSERPYSSWNTESDMVSLRVAGGSWSDKEHLEWLEKTLKKKKVEYSKIERRY